MKRIRAYSRLLTRLSRRAPPGLDCLRPPCYDKNPPLTVGRWENLSMAIARALQRSRETGPRATEKTARHRRAWALGCRTRIRAGFPRHRACARPCSSGSPDPELFVIRRSQTTAGETHIVTMEIAGDRPPRYDEKRHPIAIVRAIQRARGTGPCARGTSRPGGLSYGEAIDL